MNMYNEDVETDVIKTIETTGNETKTICFESICSETAGNKTTGNETTGNETIDTPTNETIYTTEKRDTCKRGIDW
jgi:hypothetical protein